jgi:hypothetical protein
MLLPGQVGCHGFSASTTLPSHYLKGRLAKTKVKGMHGVLQGTELLSVGYPGHC